MPDTIVPDYEIKKPKIQEDYSVNKPEGWNAEKNRPNRLAGRPEKLLENVPKRSQIVIYNRLAYDIDATLDKLYAFRDGKNERLAFEATKVILDKVLPNARAEEIANKHAPITVNLLSAGFIPPNPDDAASVGSAQRSAQIQSISLASESEEDNDSGDGSSETSNTEEGSILAPVSDLRRS